MLGSTRRKIVALFIFVVTIAALSQLSALSDYYEPLSSRAFASQTATWKEYRPTGAVPPPGRVPVLTAPGTVSNEPAAPSKTSEHQINPVADNRHPPEMIATEILLHGAGWTFFKNLYMANGTLFIVTDDKGKFPDPLLMTSTGAPAVNTPENIKEREPTERDMSFITVAAAQSRWGDRILDIQGSTFLYNDPNQFINHYYHFAAELLFGSWRMYASQDPNIDKYGNTTLPDPTRIIFAHCNAIEWRDYSHMNHYFTLSAFPSINIETFHDWQGRIDMTSSHHVQRVWRLPSVILVDRSACFRGPICGLKTQRTAAEAFEVTRNSSSRYWWEPIRRRVLSYAGVEQKVLDLALHEERWKKEIVITYISRQGGRRRLLPEDHEALVQALLAMTRRKGWELNVVKAEKLSREEQLRVAARSTVLLGVHGNGLTHLIAMPPTPISTVIEIFYPTGFAHDYEWIAETLGIRHFAVWNDTWHTAPHNLHPTYPEGFQGMSIPVHAPTIVQIIEGRVEGRLI